MKLKPDRFVKATGQFADQRGFVRHRDIKLKESELKKEEKMQESMIDGICKKCREKVQWRFKFDKYKPLKALASCQGCRQKTITKAYRTLCDVCAKKTNICPSCCVTLQDSDAVDYVDPSVALKASEALREVGKIGTVFILDGIEVETIETLEPIVTSNSNQIDESPQDMDQVEDECEHEGSQSDEENGEEGEEEEESSEESEEQK